MLQGVSLTYLPGPLATSTASPPVGKSSTSVPLFAGIDSLDPALRTRVRHSSKWATSTSNTVLCCYCSWEYKEGESMPAIPRHCQGAPHLSEKSCVPDSRTLYRCFALLATIPSIILGGINNLSMTTAGL